MHRFEAIRHIRMDSLGVNMGISTIKSLGTHLRNLKVATHISSTISKPILLSPINHNNLQFSCLSDVTWIGSVDPGLRDVGGNVNFVTDFIRSFLSRHKRVFVFNRYFFKLVT